VTTGRKGRVDERKKGWTRKPENPKKRKRASVRSFLRSVNLSGTTPILPKLFTYWPRYPSSKAENSERTKKKERERKRRE
jgi:hypothetical protein